jgi:transposase
LPRGNEARQEYAILVGADGMRLLEAIDGPSAPPALRLLPAVEVLRRTWVQQYVTLAGVLQLREPKNMPPASVQVESPYEPEARYGTKRDRGWIGYKVHVSESCDDDRPHLLTHVETTIAPATDVEQLAAVHEGLADRDLLPGEHLVDAGYVRGPNLVASQREHQIDLIGPMYEDHQWQAKAKQGFDAAHFQVDWDAQRVTCPQGKVSVRWCETETARGRTMVAVGFAAADCSACPTRSLCTRAKTGARNLTLQSRAEHEAIQMARQRQQAPEFAAQYAPRAGIEGTLSQGIRAFGLRKARYRGLAKTHLQHVATATAINLVRLADWLNGTPRATTRRSAFAALAPTG